MPDTPAFLSARARRLLDSPTAEYITAHFSRNDVAYDAVSRPDGYVGLCIAENRLLWRELSARLAAVPAAPSRVLGYDAMIGAQSFRERLARFMSTRICGRPVSADHLAVLNGAGTALEVLFYALGDPGDAVLVPTPSYAGFWPDLEHRDALTIVPVPTSSHEDFRLTEAHLDRAVASAERPVRALLYTSPDNPLGRVMSAQQVETILRWSERTEIHVVFDEVYALSVFGSTPFTSAASRRAALGDRVHIVWAFSKDFGASGLRAGVLMTENERVMQTVSTLSYWAACSGHTQYLLSEIIADDAWLDGYLSTLRTRLADVHGDVVDGLGRFGVEVIDADGGIFVVCDLRPFLAEPTFEAEDALWWALLNNAQVNLTPGSSCRIAEPGFFRLCYATSPRTAVRAGIERIGRLLNGRRPKG